MRRSFLCALTSRRLALALVLTLAIVTRARAQDSDCKNAANYGACMNAKGQKEIGGTKSEPASNSMTPREAAEKEQRRFRDSLYADSVRRANNKLTYAAPAEDKAKMHGEKAAWLRQMDQEFQPVFDQVDVPKYFRYLGELDPGRRIVFLGRDPEAEWGAVFDEDPQFWSAVFVRMGVAYFELAEVYGYVDARDPNRSWTPRRYADRGAYWLLKADSLNNGDAASVMRQLVYHPVADWATDPSSHPKPTDWRPGRIPLDPDWLTSSMSVSQSSPMAIAAQGAYRPPPVQGIDLKTRHARVAVYVAQINDKRVRDSMAVVEADAARIRAAAAAVAAADARARAATERAAVAAWATSDPAAAALTKAQIDSINEAATQMFADEYVARGRLVTADSALEAREKYFAADSVQLKKMSVTSVTPLPKAERGPLVVRALELSKTRAAAEGIRFDPATAPSPEEARRTIAEVHQLLPVVKRELADTTLWKAGARQDSETVAIREKALAQLRQALAQGCTVTQPTGCSPLADWLLINRNLFEGVQYPLARKLGEFACRQTPTASVCSQTAAQWMGRPKSQGKTLGLMVLACASEPVDPANPNKSNCSLVAVCLAGGDCGVPNLSMAVGFLRLGCVHRERSSCGDAPYASFTADIHPKRFD